MGRNKPIPVLEDYRVTTSRIGNLIIIDQHGIEPLKHPDPIKRVRFVYAAAQAEPFQFISHEFVRLHDRIDSGFHGYRHLLEFAYLTIKLATPPLDLIMKTTALSAQRELDLEEAA